jgi:hypothetical protein
MKFVGMKSEIQINNSFENATEQNFEKLNELKLTKSFWSF